MIMNRVMVAAHAGIAHRHAQLQREVGCANLSLAAVAEKLVRDLDPHYLKFALLDAMPFDKDDIDLDVTVMALCKDNGIEHEAHINDALREKVVSLFRDGETFSDGLSVRVVRSSEGIHCWKERGAGG